MGEPSEATELLPSLAKGPYEDKGPNQAKQADDITNNPLRHRQAKKTNQQNELRKLEKNENSIWRMPNLVFKGIGGMTSALRPRPRRQSPPIASLFATAPIDAGPNSKCCIFRDYFLSFFIFASILVARSGPATISALSGLHCPRPLWSDKGAPHFVGPL